MNVGFKNIEKHFGHVHANADINFEIKSGTIYGILGENGAGKSTLMKFSPGSSIRILERSVLMTLLCRLIHRRMRLNLELVCCTRTRWTSTDAGP